MALEQYLRAYNSLYFFLPWQLYGGNLVSSLLGLLWGQSLTNLFIHYPESMSVSPVFITLVKYLRLGNCIRKRVLFRSQFWTTAASGCIVSFLLAVPQCHARHVSFLIQLSGLGHDYLISPWPLPKALHYNMTALRTSLQQMNLRTCIWNCVQTVNHTTFQ